MKATVEAKVKRGKESWAFIYLILSLMLSVLGVVVGILPYEWWQKLSVFILGFLVILYLCVINAKIQNKLIALKIKIEESWKIL